MDSALRLQQSSLERAYVGFTRAILDPFRSFGFRETVPYQAFADLKPGKRVSRSFRLDRHQLSEGDIFDANLDGAD